MVKGQTLWRSDACEQSAWEGGDGVQLRLGFQSWDIRHLERLSWPSFPDQGSESCLCSGLLPSP